MANNAIVSGKNVELVKITHTWSKFVPELNLNI